MQNCPWNKLTDTPGVAREQVMKNFICLLPVAEAPYEMPSTKVTKRRFR